MNNRLLATEMAEKLTAAQAQQAQQGQCIGECNSPRPWVECSIEEKIERTRDQVKGVQNEMRYLYGRISELQRQRGEFLQHRHDMGDGQKVLLPADHPRGDDCCGQLAKKSECDPSLVYF